MKRTLARLAPVMLLCAATTARADAYDCFPAAACAHAPIGVEAAVNLCEHKAVRDLARLDRGLDPVKKVYEIATNPAGYVVKLVDRNVMPIPAWVGFAIDPRGAIRAEAMKRVRHELKKQVGLQARCAAEISAEDGSGES